MAETITILGATGSIGRSALDIVAKAPGAFEIIALTAQHNVDGLADAAIAHRVRFAAIGDPDRLHRLTERLQGTGIEAAAGPEAIVEAAARDANRVVAGIVGMAGLAPVLAAIDRGAVVAFASKECLVSAGALMMERVTAAGATLLPADSEHNAIFQVFDTATRARVRRLVLTASGGPFRTWPSSRMATVTPNQALAHPVWAMGAKISVDSATMMNKGLEIIEAAHLFDLPGSQVAVIIHPQSIIHSMVEYCDGSTLAQMGPPDMRVPLSYCLAWPDRLPQTLAPLDLVQVGALDFEPPDEGRFPSLRLARQALAAEDASAAVLNAANEVAVAAFLDGNIGFLDIATICQMVLEAAVESRPASVEEVVAVDARARRDALVAIETRRTRLTGHH